MGKPDLPENKVYAKKFLNIVKILIATKWRINTIYFNSTPLNIRLYKTATQ